MPRDPSEPGPREWSSIPCWGCQEIAAYTFAAAGVAKRIENESPLWCVTCFRSTARRKSRGARSSCGRAKEKPNGSA